MAKPKFEEPGHYTKKDREKIKHFAGPGESYPIEVPQDVEDAAHLVGHAADPAAVKAKIISIAHEMGPEFVAKIPDSWRADAAVVTRSAVSPSGAEQIFTAPITRVDPDKRMVTVTATSEAVDSFGTIFDYDASKDAFMRWVGNIREMHQPKAVGTRVGVHCDDEARKIDVTMRISKGAQDTWEKVLDGTLRGASIGASNVTWVHGRAGGGPAVPRASKYNLVELSLVDNASNGDCMNVSVMRNALPDLNTLDLLDEQEQHMAERAQSAAEAEAAAIAALPAVTAQTTQLARSVDPNALTAAPTAAEPVASESATPAGEMAAAVAAEIRASRRNSGWEDRIEAVNAKRMLETEIKLAGERAVAGMQPQRGEDYPTFAARLAGLRGAAEQRALLAQKQRLAAAAAPAPAAEPEVTRADGDNGALIEVVALPSDKTDAAGGHSDSGAGLSTGETAHLHADDAKEPLAQSGDDVLHEHEHTHADGTTHTHPHAHTGPHEHEHHHSYRAGKPIDSRVLLAEAQRGNASFSNPAGKQDGYDGPERDHPVSGSAQKSGAAESGLEKMTPSTVGHPVAYNTETTQQFAFGVGRPAEDVPPSPDQGGDYTLDASTFHPQGHGDVAAGGMPDETLSGSVPGGLDVDGDHDDGADVDEITSGPDHASEAPMASRPEFLARPTPEGRAATIPAPGAAKPAVAKNANKSNGQKNAAVVSGEDDADEAEPGDALASSSDDGDESASAEGRTHQPTETRKGARISAESRAALHVARDSQVNAVKAVCEHCGCPECNAHLEALAAAANEPAKLEEGGMPLSVGAMGGARSAVAEFAQRRILSALMDKAIERAVSAAVTEITNTLTSQLAGQVTSRLADLELTLADLQIRQSSVAETRNNTAQTQRAIESAIETRLAAALTPFTAQLEAVASLGEGLKAVGDVRATVGEMAERVRRIDAQPGPSAMLGPTAGIADRRLPLDPSGATRAVAGASTDEQIALLTAIGRNSVNPAVQSEMAAQILMLQQRGR